MNWIVALPMYNVTTLLDQQWRALLRDVIMQLRAMGIKDAITVHDAPGPDIAALWQRPDLLLSQTCGYPLMFQLKEKVQVVAAPVFDVEGCDGPSYRSAIVVSDNAYASGATELAACRGLRAAYNTMDSHSGMNAFRDRVAPLAKDGRFFASVVETGSHIASLQAVAQGHVDIAAIDCVTLAYARDAFPFVRQRTHCIDLTVPAPSLPFIASPYVDGTLLAQLRVALATAITLDDGRARALRLTGIAPMNRAAYHAIVSAESRAIAAGYPSLS
ncbi:hypothetical protein WM40_09865 [Robbsia andropogonis]|uniref:Phosphate ABC transporter substrate-binding protein n=1 Tax=Robbsia andropogonis TaxID=28092 RepID=A0A0F5K0L0_9BURK|nr:PhnD/SsuA/transferrin family substrate-binding protein [Robbsia andropogonis]KKB63646.1 hypothetical protein WM40_09865 [Robbsia andropogonis]MCP1119368.1 PhnD/SsuA/transferrin family substrate-binding protein [Robbsia andropogonis]MCP1129209.1 PhnD/SsuA/transferrin family substrate-binding protein [Robbsia andropogonis]